MYVRAKCVGKILRRNGDTRKQHYNPRIWRTNSNPYSLDEKNYAMYVLIVSGKSYAEMEEIRLTV